MEAAGQVRATMGEHKERTPATTRYADRNRPLPSQRTGLAVTEGARLPFHALHAEARRLHHSAFDTRVNAPLLEAAQAGAKREETGSAAAL